jgi:hypothetical protein
VGILWLTLAITSYSRSPGLTGEYEGVIDIGTDKSKTLFENASKLKSNPSGLEPSNSNSS